MVHGVDANVLVEKLNCSSGQTVSFAADFVEPPGACAVPGGSSVLQRRKPHAPLVPTEERLRLCAGFVPENARLADIGTDHAYLPVWLCRSGKIQKAIAADIGEGPCRAPGIPLPGIR